MSNSKKLMKGTSQCTKAQACGKVFEVLSLLALLFFFVASPKAHAYIDPTTGSYLLELTAGAFFTIMFSAKCFFKSIKQRLAFSVSPDPKK